MCFQRSKRNRLLYFTSSTFHNLLVENPINQQVGERVAQVRTQMKLTQAELASEMSARLGRDIRPLTVTRLEGGKRPITIDELIAVAATLRVSVQDLIGPGDLPMAAIAVQSLAAEALRAMNALDKAVREWVWTRKMLEDAFRYKSGAKLSMASREWAKSLIELDVHQIVNDAVAGAEAEDAKT